jgi:opacity protein-like surface antigen
MKRIAFSALFLFPLVTGSTSANAGELQLESRWSKTPSWARNDVPRAEREEAPEEHSDKPERSASRGRRPTSLQSQTRISPFVPGSSNVSLDVGQVFLMGNLGDRYTDSIGSRLNYTYGVSDMFSFNSSFGYSTHAEGNFSMTSLLAGLRTNLAWYDKVIPYAIFGMGFYRPSYRDANYSSTLFGVHLGAGVNLELTSSLFFGASMTFHDTFGSDHTLPSGGAIPVGGSFTSFFLSAGVSF